LIIAQILSTQDSQQFNLAQDTFKSAIATVEGLRGEIISGEESKRIPNGYIFIVTVVLIYNHH